MAYPSIVDSAVSAHSTGSSLALTMPASIVAGNLLLAFCAARANATMTMSGWTSVGATNVSSSYPGMNVFAKTAAGSDTGTLTISASEAAAIVTYQISGWSGSIPGIGYAATNGTGTASSPNLAMGSSADYLWFAFVGYPTSGGPSASPSGFSAITAEAGSTLVGISTANAQITAASENPGSWTGSLTFWIAGTVGIPPVAAAANPPALRVVNTAVMRASFY
jgi:hypothetical protein